MDILSILKNEKIGQMVAQQHLISKEKQQVAFNLFTLSSYNSYLENFHSDIIATLLNPSGPHNEGNVFLNLFIGYLKKYHTVEIDADVFHDAVVTRETGRLDIWVRDKELKQSIIIENKINNAWDRDGQLDDYHSYSIAKDCDVKAIVYLSLDGSKHAPNSVGIPRHIIKNIGAFNNSNADLIQGWLLPCFEKATTKDSSTFLWQYIKLIKHLGFKNMDNNIMNEFYTFLNEKNGLGTVNTIVEMAGKVSTYRAEKYNTAIEEFGPFTNKAKYKPYYLLFYFWVVDGDKLKLDVWFNADGSAEMVFWNTSKEGEPGRKTLTNVLQNSGMLEEFADEIYFNYNGYPKRFFLGEQYKTMLEIDEAIITFTKKFLDALKNS